MFTKKKSKALLPILVICPAILLITIFIIIPAIINVYFSFTNYNGNIRLPIAWVGFDNYRYIFLLGKDDIMQSLKVTFIFALSIMFIQNILALLIAVLVNMKLRLSTFYRALFFMPMILGVVVIGLVWTLMLDPNSGFMSYLLGLFGQSSAFLGDDKLALPLVIFITIWANFGFLMVIYLAGLQNIPEEIYEAAIVDGASSIDKLLYITWPLIRPSVTINGLITLIGSLGLYDLVYILTGGGPINTTRGFSLYIFQLISSSSNQGIVSAMSIIMFLITSVLVIIYQYISGRKEVEL